MNNKYRIKEISFSFGEGITVKRYKVEKRRFFFWWRIEKNSLFILPSLFDTYEAAKNFISSRKGILLYIC